jgi:cytochrome c peroxidase
MERLRTVRNTSLVQSPRSFSLAIGVLTLVVCCAFLISPTREEGRVNSYYLRELDHLKQEFENFRELCVNKRPLKEIRQEFLKGRMVYKSLAVLTDYFCVAETKQLNGPNLNWAEDDNPDVVLAPHGFQVMEELIFHRQRIEIYTPLRNEIDHALQVISKLQGERDLQDKFKDEYIFEALRSSMVRLITLGITGHDSPIAKNSIEEASATLSGIESILNLYADDLSKKAGNTKARIDDLITESKNYIGPHKDFNSFDRLNFIIKYADPLYSLLSEAKKMLNLPAIGGKRALNQNAQSLFDRDAFDINFFSPDPQYQITGERIELGKRLFSDPLLSGNKSRSCASCHDPKLAFTDGIKVPKNIDGKTLLSRNTPTLLNSVFQTKLFYDSRTDILENQLEEVVHNVSEMKGSLKASVEILKKDPAYASLFKKAYANEKESVTGYNIANAISSYVRSLAALNSRFDHYMHGDSTALSANEKKGFNLFTGKANCATCHFIPLFNGLVPPEFNETESEVLGVPQTDRKGKTVIDPDPGKYDFTKSAVDKYAFKTPTLRNVSITAPYMHNGVFKTLEDVIDFYNDGGGLGWKTSPANQTLPKENLHLSAKEKKQLISFLNALTDTSSVN